MNFEFFMRVRRLPWPSANAKSLAYAIAWHCGTEEGHCWASQATLARESQLNERTVRRLLEEMEEMGVITRYSQKAAGSKFQTDIIQFTLPEVTLPAMEKKPIKPRSAARLALDHEPSTPAPETQTDEKREISHETDKSDFGVSLQDVRTQSPDPSGHSARTRPDTESDKLTHITKPENSLAEPPVPSQDHWSGTSRLSGPASFDAEWDVSGLELDVAHLIGAHASAFCRDRSSPEQTRLAIIEFRGRWPGTSDALWFTAVCRAVRKYCDSDVATKEEGRYCRGLHRLFPLDSFQQSVDLEISRMVSGNVSTSGPGAPDRKTQTMWARGFATQNGLWPKAQGPDPYSFRCRIDRDILMAFGVTEQKIRAEALRRLERWFTLGRWSPDYGPEPGTEACWIPADIVAEARAKWGSPVSADGGVLISAASDEAEKINTVVPAGTDPAPEAPEATETENPPDLSTGDDDEAAFA